MLSKFKSFIKDKGLVHESDRLILGVSGGIDSVVMADLFAKAGYHFAIAHCNFKLRGNESDEDQGFVRELARRYQSEFYTKDFNTSDYASDHGVSIQMAARDLRYSWFKEVADTEGFDRVSIGHNRDDIAETMILNLIRGTGIKGLTGIKPVHENIIRPLLFAGRAEIEEYAIKEKLTYREDSSNLGIKYHRNLIRHEILPLMRKINPALYETLNFEAEIFSSTYTLYRKELKQVRDAITVEENRKWVLSIPKMLSLRINAAILFDLISPYGFTYTDAMNLIICLQAESGRIFYSSQFVLLKDRQTVIIEKYDRNEEDQEYEIPEHITALGYPLKLTFTKIIRTASFEIPTSPDSIALDANSVHFPLKMRKWKPGDFFVPLGMTGKKKLSDFFIDRKINIIEKKKIWLLLSKGDIVWIIGHQIDNRYKVNPQTENILMISLKD